MYMYLNLVIFLYILLYFWGYFYNFPGIHYPFADVFSISTS